MRGSSISVQLKAAENTIIIKSGRFMNLQICNICKISEAVRLFSDLRRVVTHNKEIINIFSMHGGVDREGNARSSVCDHVKTLLPCPPSHFFMTLYRLTNEEGPVPPHSQHSEAWNNDLLGLNTVSPEFGRIGMAGTNAWQCEEMLDGGLGVNSVK
jgi:hypothetical protein